jgi:hypothetical protein
MKRYNQNLFGFGEIIIEADDGKWVTFEDAEREIVTEVTEANEELEKYMEIVYNLVNESKVQQKEYERVKFEVMVLGYLGSFIMFAFGLAMGHFFL